MELKLRDKIALVTGSTAGIGFAIAELLAQEGAVVAINGRTPRRVTDAINKIKEKNASAKLLPIVADLSTSHGCELVTQEIPSVDILVNNVGMYEVKSFKEITDDDWLNIFNINVMSGIRLSRHYFPQMLKRNWGRIIFISSESGIQIPSEMIHYGMTKAAEIVFARGLAELTSHTNVTVNCILPGPTRSEGVNDFVENVAKSRKMDPIQVEKEFFETVRPTSILKRFITTEEVANLVAFVASPLSSGTNGAALRVDGGVIRAMV